MTVLTNQQLETYRLPSEHKGLFVHGTDPNRVRAEAYDVEVPEFSKTSFFAQQSNQERRQ